MSTCWSPSCWDCFATAADHCHKCWSWLCFSCSQFICSVEQEKNTNEHNNEMQCEQVERWSRSVDVFYFPHFVARFAAVVSFCGSPLTFTFRALIFFSLAFVANFIQNTFFFTFHFLISLFFFFLAVLWLTQLLFYDFLFIFYFT